MMEEGKERIVHIFPQAYFHQDALIVGNRLGLIALKEAIEHALEEGRAECILMPSDEENYTCHIALNDEELKAPFWQRMKEPYAELLDDDPEAFDPTTLIDNRLFESADIQRVEMEMKHYQQISEEMSRKIIAKSGLSDQKNK